MPFVTFLCCILVYSAIEFILLRLLFFNALQHKPGCCAQSCWPERQRRAGLQRCAPL
ncbi:hypothetical protein BC629DRAFT_1453412 [Irpex lacteus]|nr:hypothetical protein BC629DRAFT_1523660 [Irpex lacteus]KAI0797339.1 hypothetical protein BC629DRAFT_1503191 [Irpex lacteus]KAI0826142.1 hypothetical protein BC629DRAFT_1453412 [Irpex lacteus]